MGLCIPYITNSMSANTQRVSNILIDKTTKLNYVMDCSVINVRDILWPEVCLMGPSL